MRKWIAVIGLVVLAGCSGESLTGSTALEPQPALSAASVAATSVIPATVEPTPEIGPSYWSAWYDEQAVLHHSNLSGHWQEVTSCSYYGSTFLGSAHAMVMPHESMSVALGVTWRTMLLLWRADPAMPLPARVQLLAIAGPGRTCTADPTAIGNVTARGSYYWSP